LIFLAHQVGSALGAWLPGVVHDATGSYDASFVAAILLLVGAGVVSLLLPRPARGAEPVTGRVSDESAAEPVAP
jgi:predicted MFS family arabinose efflux permease